MDGVFQKEIPKYTYLAFWIFQKGWYPVGPNIRWNREELLKDTLLVGNLRWKEAGEEVKFHLLTRFPSFFVSPEKRNSYMTGFIRRPFAKGSGIAPGQLYNLEKDPGEQNNFYKKRPGVVKRLKKKLNEMR